MKCHVCDVNKLSKEFPRENLSNECSHPPIHCFACVIKLLEKSSAGVKCPYNNDKDVHVQCDATIDNPQNVVKMCKIELDLLYPPVHSSVSDVELQQSYSNATSRVVSVVMLTGDSQAFTVNQYMKVSELKKLIANHFKVDPDKQQLTCNEQILETFKENGQEAVLGDYNFQSMATIHLMVLLYAIPSHFNHVIFDLFWGYPKGGCDYLDASCLTFSGKSHQHVADYQNRRVGTSIHHSGDVMDNHNKIGHHTIEAHLKDIPANITHLFFTLSAWNSPTISHFPNPSLKFFEASNKTKDLCKTSFSHAKHSQAIIMCYVRRIGSQWQIYEGGILSPGNARNYQPIIATILGPVMAASFN